MLVAGTAIGVGMLALPVVTADAGLFPSIVLYVAAWLYMLSTGFLILEACQWAPRDANLITLSRLFLGDRGATVCWTLYLFLFYCLMIAHISAGGEAVALFGGAHWFSALLYVALFAPAIYLGALWAGRVNALLMVGVVISFALLLFPSLYAIRPSLFLPAHWTSLISSLPIVLIAFGYQNLIPTLISYMDRDIPKVKQALWIGTSIPLLLYLIWEVMILGIVPREDLHQALLQGQNAVIPLQNRLALPWIGTMSQCFAFFAMTTSFIGISIAFFDFWADGLRWKKTGLHKVVLSLLVFGIPLLVVWGNPAIFFHALRWAGVLGALLLFCVMPVLFVWAGRYRQGYSKEYQHVKGGRISLVAILVIALWGILFSLFR